MCNFVDERESTKERGSGVKGKVRRAGVIRSIREKVRGEEEGSRGRCEGRV
jgi:hypothetical protein